MTDVFFIITHHLISGLWKMLRVVIPTNINQSAVPHPLLDHCISQPVCRWLTDWRWINRSEQHQEPPFQAEQSSPVCPAPLFGCAVTLQTKWTIWKYKLNLVTVSPVTHCLENSELGLYLALFIHNKVSIKIILNADFFVLFCFDQLLTWQQGALKPTFI